MKRLAFTTIVMSGIIGVAIGTNGCEYNPFSPPDKTKPWPTNSSGSSGGDTMSGGGGGGMGGVAGTGGAAGAGGPGNADGGMVDADAGLEPAPCFCQDDNKPCTTETVDAGCPDGGEEACHTVMLGASCALPNGADGGLCNPDGECRDCMQCSDALCVDRCNGYACTATAICKSGYCSDEKTCCNGDCPGLCRICNWPDRPGTCTRFPNGSQVPGCLNTNACDSGGECSGRTGAPLGAGCSSAGQCQSGLCKAQLCRSVVGEPCVDHVECGTNFCNPATKTCMSCKDPLAGICPGGATTCLADGKCQALLGQPGDANIADDCITGAAPLWFLCRIAEGGACTAHEECAYGHCSSEGKCLGPCGTLACASGTSCSPLQNGHCLLKAGSYCVINDQCQSQVCAGFPKRCI